MAPWSSQRHAPPPRPPTLRQTSADLVSRIHSPSHTAPPGQLGRLPDSYVILDNSHLHADSSSSESDFHPRRPRRPTHSRSMSHPFPSLFSSKKKRPDTSHDTDSEDDAPVMTKPPGNNNTTHKRGGTSGGSRDFATGNCMTCGSLVRWPRELKVFKCTVCVTINDIHPDQLPARSNSGPKWLQRPSQESTSPQKQTTRPAERYETRPISLDQTKRLIRQSIHAHLARAIRRSSSSEDEHREVVAERHATPSPFREQSERPCTSRTKGGPQHRRERSQGNGSGYLFPEQPTLRQNPNLHPLRLPPTARSFSSSYPERPTMRQLTADASAPRPAGPRFLDADDPKRIFRPLEDYITTCFSSFHCVNSSFLSRRPVVATRSGSESASRRPPIPRPEPKYAEQHSESPVCDLDPKLLLLGDFAENGTWWTGNQSQGGTRHKRSASQRMEDAPSFITSRSPQVEWNQVTEWYRSVINAAESWMSIYEEMTRDSEADPLSATELRAIESQLLFGQDHTHRILLKAIETLLKRPGRPMTDPEDLRYLLIILENPLLYGESNAFQGRGNNDRRPSLKRDEIIREDRSTLKTGPVSGQHSVIIKRILGLISNSSTSCQNHLTTWFARYSEARFIKITDLAAGFLTYRLIRQNEKKHEVRVDITAGLIPNMSAGHSAASLHAALGTQRSSSKQQKEQQKKMVYNEDWQIRAAARVLSLVFAANNMTHIRRPDQTGNMSSSTHRGGIQAHGQIIPTSDFYNTMIDYTDLVAEFEAWESKRGKFSFCQYPFLLSMWAKSQILEHDARRQQMTKARDAFFDSIMTRRNVTQFLVLDVRRECLVDDSLKAVSEVIGSGSEDIKKGLRIVFKGEEGLDAGGLKKEWFLLLVREVFNPEHGMFIYDEDSQFCYFNPNAFETSDQFFLVGVVMGLAIYNSTILDVALPPFAFRKLLASAPSSSSGSSAHPRPTMNYTLEDLSEYRPRLASGLKQLLEFDGDVETTFQLDFVVDIEKYGTVMQVPLCPGGERKPVTNANRAEYVTLYVRYLLETAVARQFEPFKRGFYTVCGGNALSLFRPEEIELLVRGSDTALDVDALRGVAEYDNWGSKNPDGVEPVIGWFWDAFKNATADEQRKLLSFITGTDRVPAMGAALLPIKITCLGDDENRYPIARTCFNMLALRRYGSRERLEHMLWTAVHESEGFGLK
ncbi:HECT-domain-containing protein [Colletotrichum scovillei]|uniref:HECT-type E3 ubiquitin transferase n=1 Tax=Colletotrichum scovillei TaxID=1209932 RepID=A0A9P7RDB2_9PEZI|nr:HECT-domain-containing protein [Colletotrichum scovillei]KAF4776165.1 HECT-domain-containing protein [Colletotrichum scovillei]KAG7054089.1 HECT domain ubiquitin protein ligase e3 [Colletotrichum scovillei]KAG7072385.1 HECT domain ubiquitin protein ligase e3 [Colletotrichum scovillei]KAG7080608.1 HECT domain ubiquitin protein ligase e3 [Colletotrichum scovillei]